MYYPLSRHTLVRLLAATLTLILWGCGSAQPTLLFRPPGATDLVLSITLERNESAKLITLMVNGTKVCSEPVDAFNGGEEMKGNYRGHLMAAQIHTITSYVTNQEITSCSVTYDGGPAGEIELHKTKLP